MARANAAYYAAHDPFADFTTSPEITQVFGEVLGLWAAVTWEAMGRPDPVLLVECGPGRGTAMADALRAAGVETTLAVMYKQGHAFLNPGDPQTYGAMAVEWLTRHLKP